MKDRTPLRATFQDRNSQSDWAFRSDSSFDPGVLERQAIAALIHADRAALEALASEAAERLRAGAQPEISAEAVETHRLYAAVLAHSARNLRLLHRRHQARMEAHLRLSGPA